MDQTNRSTYAFENARAVQRERLGCATALCDDPRLAFMSQATIGAWGYRPSESSVPADGIEPLEANLQALSRNVLDAHRPKLERKELRKTAGRQRAALPHPALKMYASRSGKPEIAHAPNPAVAALRPSPRHGFRDLHRRERDLTARSVDLAKPPHAHHVVLDLGVAATEQAALGRPIMQTVPDQGGRTRYPGVGVPCGFVGQPQPLLMGIDRQIRPALVPVNGGERGSGTRAGQHGCHASDRDQHQWNQ